MGPRVRIVGQLIDARNDKHLWADTYDRDLKDIFAIQSEVAQTIAAALKAKLSPDEKNLIEKKATESLDAYAYYLRGRDYYYRLTKDDNERAIEMFKKAIVLDPKYALAHAGLADAYAQRVQRFGYDVHWADSSIRISEYAIELDPNIPEPYKSLGLAYYQRAWYQRAGEQYRKALALNPNYASVLANYGELTSWTGRQDEGLPYVKKSILLMPGRTASYHVLGTIYRELEMDTAAEHWYKRAIELDPSYIYSYVGLSQLYMTNGRMKDARVIIDSLKQTYPDESFVLTGAGDVELFSGDYLAARNLYQKAIEFSSVQSGPSTQLGFVLLKTGNIREGNELLGQSIKIALSQLASKSEEPEYRYDLARVYAVKKDTTKAIEWLRQSIELGWRLYRWTLQDPLLENIRSTHDFRQLMNGLKMKIETMRTRVVSQELSEQQSMTR
jgi:protein kinase/serine/threonine-protein kinase